MAARRATAAVPVRRIRTEQPWSWLDLRLVPPAAVVWAATLLARPQPAGWLLCAAVVCAIGSGVLLIWSGNRSGGASVVVVGCLAALTLVAAVSSVRALVRASSPLPELAAREAVVPVVVQLDDDPRMLAGAGGPRVLVRSSLTEADGHSVDGDPVLLFGP